MLRTGLGEDCDVGGTAFVAACTVGSGLDWRRLSCDSWLSRLAESGGCVLSCALSPWIVVATRSCS